MNKENEVTIEVVYDGKKRILSGDELKNLAQKGLNYDRMNEKYENAVTELDKLSGYKNMIINFADTLGVSPELAIGELKKLAEAARVNTYAAEENIPEEYAKKLLAMDHEIRLLKKERDELAPMKKRAEDTEAFKKEYPGIDINDIDKEIIDEWNSSEKSLVDIYNRIMLRKLMLDKAAESANEKNKNASTGSVSGISAPEKYYTDDEVRKMSDEEFSKNFRKILLQKKKEKEMNANG